MPNDHHFILQHLSDVSSEPFAEKQEGIRIPQAHSFASANAPGELRPISFSDIQELGGNEANRLKKLSV